MEFLRGIAVIVGYLSIMTVIAVVSAGALAPALYGILGIEYSEGDAVLWFIVGATAGFFFLLFQEEKR